MSIEITMPGLTDSMQEGIILEWFKQPGDTVLVGDDLVEIESEKANLVYAAEVAGTNLEIVVAKHSSAHVGEIIARLSPADIELETRAGEGELGPTRRSRRTAVNISPIARRLAEAEGVEISILAGTGPGGRITRNDVAAAAIAARGGSPEAEPAASSATQPNGSPDASSDDSYSAKGRVTKTPLRAYPGRSF